MASAASSMDWISILCQSDFWYHYHTSKINYCIVPFHFYCLLLWGCSLCLSRKVISFPGKNGPWISCTLEEKSHQSASPLPCAARSVLVTWPQACAWAAHSSTQRVGRATDVVFASGIVLAGKQMNNDTHSAQFCCCFRGILFLFVLY